MKLVCLWLVAAVLAASPNADAASNPDGVAVIVGNRTYSHERVADVDYAHRDAEAFKRYVVDVLGFDPVNIIDLRDATQAQMLSTFGNERDHRGSRLWRYLDPDGHSDVVVFYSGHGVPGLRDNRAYLLPTDADPNTAELNGYPIDLLYRNLAGMSEARSVRVFLDACFSGDSQSGMLIRSASPVFVAPAMPDTGGRSIAILTAAGRGEVASWDEQARHGLFTHHVLDALYGRGDLDGDGDVTAVEAKQYLDRHMTRAARRAYGRDQRASFNGDGTALLTRFSGGVFPERPILRDEPPEAARQGIAAEQREPPTARTPTPSATAEAQFWDSIKDSDDAGDLQAYLDTYADGVFAGLARSRLRGMVWDPIKNSTDAVAFNEYLTRFPSGEFAGLASAKLGVIANGASQTALEHWANDTARSSELNELARARLAAIEEENLAKDEAFQALLDAANAAAEPAVGKVFRDCPECPEMIVVPAGRSPIVADPIEWAVLRPFAVARFETTFDEFEAFVGRTKYRPARSCKTYRPGKATRTNLDWRSPGFRQTATHPAVCVSPKDSRAYIDWLSSRTGHSYRLMSSFEWAHVATEGRGSPAWHREPQHFQVGDWVTEQGIEFIASQAQDGSSMGPVLSKKDWTKAMSESGQSGSYADYVEHHATMQALYESVAYRAKEAEQAREAALWVRKQCDYWNGPDQSLRKNQPWSTAPCDDGHVYAAPVGSFSPNDFGLHDVVGNVSEWLGQCAAAPGRRAPAAGTASTLGSRLRDLPA